MKLVSSIVFILKFFIAVIILITFQFLSRNVQRGFICGDPSLSLNRKPDTVSNVLLVIWGASPPLILLISEMCFNYDKSVKFRVCMKKSWRNVAYLTHHYLIDMSLMHLLVMCAKFFTGSHRPHFFETCKPDKMFNCTLGTFVSDYKCTNTETNFLNIYDASMSFFSGHAATCVFSCFFIIWYIQRRVKQSSLILTPFLQASLICFSYFGSISRVFDQRHHWWDVLAGCIVGLLASYHTCYVLSKNSLSESGEAENDSDNTFLPTSHKISSEEQN